MTFYGKDRFCHQGQHYAPTDSFRPVPGLKYRREVCEKCYEKIMAGRKEKKK